MEKTRKERINSIPNKRIVDQFNQSHIAYKKGTTVLSTTLLISLLAFPSFSVSATANDLANSSTKKLENEKVIVEEKDGVSEEVDTDKQPIVALTEESLIIREQRINELKLLLSESQIDELIFEELTTDQIEDLFIEALAGSNMESIVSEESAETENSSSTMIVDDNSAITYELTEAEIVDVSDEIDEAIKIADEKAMETEKAATEKLAAEKAATEKLAAEKAATEKLAAEKLAAEKAATEKLAVEKAAADKLAVEKAATEKLAVEKAAADKLAVEKAATEKLAAEKVAAEKLAAEKVAAEKLAAEKLAAEKAATAKTTAVKTELAKVYIVKSGDTLNKIAKAHKVSVADLKVWNKLTSDLIHPGKSLAVNKAGAEVVKTSNEVINSTNSIQKMTNKEFIDFIGAYAAEVAPKNDLYASVMVAQAALESGFGGSKLSSSPNHNLFGIKGSYQGQTVTMYTSEYSDKGGWIYIPQNFKKYPSHAESLQDNANLLKNGTNWDSNFYSGAWVSNTSSYTDATAWLQGRYATDPSYASKLNRIISEYNLSRFDKGYTGGETITKPTPTPKPEDNTSGSNGIDSNTTVTSSYQVKSGDSLWAIAASKNVSVANLKSWNNLKSDVIYVGQKLVIKETTPAPAPKPEVDKPSTTPTVTASYQVKSGDSLWAIAASKNVSVANLKSWNNLKSDVIYVGQKLVIKETTPTPAPKPEVDKPSTTPTVTASYQVKSGDSLWSIAASKNVSVANLKSWNNLKSDVIYVGQKLVIKETTPTPAPKPEVDKPSTTPTVTASYQVKSGDSLWSIAASKNVSVANLKSWNNLKSDVIYIGQKLVIKETTPTPAPKPEVDKPSTTPTVTASYQVKSGDSLWSIAASKNVSVANLKLWNNLKSDVIYIGQKLVIKGSTSTVSSNNTTGSNETTKPSLSTTYLVKSGDSLWAIANEYNLTVAKLKQLNNLKSDALTIGQKLMVQSTPQSEPVKETTTKIYKILSGDSLWSVASKFNTSVAKLKELNYLKTDIIFVGQSIIIK